MASLVGRIMVVTTPSHVYVARDEQYAHTNFPEEQPQVGKRSEIWAKAAGGPGPIAPGHEHYSAQRLMALALPPLSGPVGVSQCF